MVRNLDNQQGAVEIKDALTDTRAKVKSDGTDNALVVMQNSAGPLPTGGATAANQATEIARLTDILAKIIAAPATEAKQDTGNTSLASILAAVDGLEGFTDGVEAALALLAPAASCAAITPNDGADLAANTRALMVSVGGDVKVDFVTGGTGIVLTGLLAGVAYPFRIKKVWSASTTATGILGLS